jgi:hypothetical protein
MIEIGNDKGHAIWEAKLPSRFSRPADTSCALSHRRSEMRSGILGLTAVFCRAVTQFIKDKYVRRIYANPELVATIEKRPSGSSVKSSRTQPEHPEKKEPSKESSAGRSSREKDPDASNDVRPEGERRRSDRDKSERREHSEKRESSSRHRSDRREHSERSERREKADRAKESGTSKEKYVSVIAFGIHDVDT